MTRRGYDLDESCRGRPRGRQSYTTRTVLNSIAIIAAKNNIDPEMLFDTFTNAWKDKESRCANLNVECRKTSVDIAIFLVTCNNSVVCQIPIETEVLEQSKVSKSYLPVIPPVEKEDYLKPRQIGELRVNMRHVTVTGEVLEISPKVLVNTIYGSNAYVSNAILADKTGKIKLSLWNDQIERVAVGDTVCIEKGRVAEFQNELQLRIGRGGTLLVNGVNVMARELAA
jgi:replication factor A1